MNMLGDNQVKQSNMSKVDLLPIANELEEKLIEWFLEERRDLPWRQTDDPYAIWVSEIMLQQTQVETVISYYLRFMELFPSITSLANSDIADVLKAWEGLGYYRRARLLHEGSRFVTDHYEGVLPESEEELLRIPGLGHYTAAAIRAFAFEKRSAAIDGNSFRVLSRVMAQPWQVGRAKDQTEARSKLYAIATDKNSHHLNEGLIELGAKICRPRPECPVCPIRGVCRAFALKEVTHFPIPKRRTSVPQEDWTFFILRDTHGRILVEQRPEKGLLAGLWQLPALDGHASKEEWAARLESSGISTDRGPKLVTTKKHVFSHKIWNMEIREALIHTDVRHDDESKEAISSSLPLSDGDQLDAEYWLGEGQLRLVTTTELSSLTFSSALADIRDQLS